MLEQQITATLTESLKPVHLEVTNESGQHNVPPGSETHFRVVAVSDAFEGRGKVARHREIYRCLAQPLQNGLHALALHTYTPREWRERGGDAPASPECRGGSGARS